MDAATAIRATLAPWTKAALDRNWDSMISLCTSDVVFAPPGSRVFLVKRSDSGWRLSLS